MKFKYSFDGETEYLVSIGSETDDFERVHPIVEKIELNGKDVDRATFRAILSRPDFSRAFDLELHQIRMENFEPEN